MKTDIHEYAEEMAVEINKLNASDGEEYKSIINDDTYKAHIEERYVIVAYNEGGHNLTEVDLIDLLKFVKREMPDIWNDV